MQDNGEGGGAPPDRFFLACTAGCSYTTGARVLDDGIDGGNIQVEKSTGGSDGSQARPATMILDPLLAGETRPGVEVAFTVRAFDQNQDPLANVPVTLAGTAGGEVVQTLTALTDGTGTASFIATSLAETVEYRATAGSAESNTVVLTGLLG